MNFEKALSQMPHTGPMRLIRRIVSADETSVRCIAVDHNDASFPLRLDDQLHSVTLVELAAQAAAAHAALFYIRGNQTGLLVALKFVMPMRQFIESVPEPFSIVADQLHFDANGSIYKFRISSGDIEFLTGQVTLKMKGELE